MTHAHLEPDRDQLEIFMDCLLRHRGNKGYLSLRAFTHSDTLLKPIIKAQLKHDDFRHIVDYAEDVARRAANNPEAAVFCPPIAVFNGKSGWQAREQDLLRGLAISVECDDHPDEAMQRLEEILGEATAVVRSGGQWVNGDGKPEDKLHLHWRLKNPAEGDKLRDLKKARKLATAIAGGDPSNIPAVHCLRWPGSWHRKGTPRLCEFFRYNADVEIDLDEALKALEKVAPRPKPDDGGESSATGDALDWQKSFADIITGKSFHPTLTPLAASFAACGIPKGGALRALRALLTNTQTTDPARIARRDTELAKLKDTVGSGYKKFEPTPTKAELFDPWQQFIVPEFPLDVLAPVARNFILDQSYAMGVDKSAMAMATLAAFSGAIHHRFRIKMTRHTDWWEHMRLWVLLVGRSSWKKTPIINAATRPIERYEVERMRDYRAAMRDYQAAKKRGDKDAEEPEPPERYTVGDTTTEKLGEILSRSERGVLAKYDEVAGWIGRMERYHAAGKGASADRAVWLQSWNGGSYPIDRVKGGDMFVQNLSVSILGGIQPARLHEIHGLTSDGLLQRLMPILMRAPTFPLDIDCSQSNKDYEALIYQLIALPPQRLQLANSAVEAMAALQIHLHHLEQVGEALSEGFEGHVGKIKAYAGVLAIILHLIGDNPKDRFIGRTVVENVDRIIRVFLLPHAHEFYSQGEGEGERLRKLASYVLTCGKSCLRLADLTNNVRDCRGLTVLAINERVSPLVAGGWLEPIAKGPDCRAWDVNRAVIDAQFAERAREEQQRKLVVAQLMRCA